MKTNPFIIPAALRRLHGPAPYDAVFIDATARAAIATNGNAIAILPVPGDLKSHRIIPFADEPLAFSPEVGNEHPEEPWGWETIEETNAARPPVYRITVNARELADLAAALGCEENATLEFRSPELPVRLSPPEGNARGYFMPLGGEGAIGMEAPAPERAASKAPVVTYVEERTSIEITFDGRPEKSVLEALKAPDLAFRYSGNNGTKRGVPPRTWYGPDNPYTREKITQILGQGDAAAA